MSSGMMKTFSRKPIEHRNPATWDCTTHSSFEINIKRENKTKKYFAAISITNAGNSGSWVLERAPGLWPGDRGLHQGRSTSMCGPGSSHWDDSICASPGQKLRKDGCTRKLRAHKGHNLQILKIKEKPYQCFPVSPLIRTMSPLSWCCGWAQPWPHLDPHKCPLTEGE